MYKYSACGKFNCNNVLHTAEAKTLREFQREAACFRQNPRQQHLAARREHRHLARLKCAGLRLQQTVYLERFLIDRNLHQRFNSSVGSWREDR